MGLGCVVFSCWLLLSLLVPKECCVILSCVMFRSLRNNEPWFETQNCVGVIVVYILQFHSCWISNCSCRVRLIG